MYFYETAYPFVRSVSYKYYLIIGAYWLAFGRIGFFLVRALANIACSLLFLAFSLFFIFYRLPIVSSPIQFAINQITTKLWLWQLYSDCHIFFQFFLYMRLIGLFRLLTNVHLFLIWLVQ